MTLELGVAKVVIVFLTYLLITKLKLGEIYLTSIVAMIVSIGLVIVVQQRGYLRFLSHLNSNCDSEKAKGVAK